MKDNTLRKPKFEIRNDERGSAMVMVLLVSFLLLVASAGLMLEVSLNTANVSDATAEQQAYNAAESGIQSALNVLRGNTVPSPLLDNSKAASDPENLIDFRRAITLADSNDPTDTSTVSRLSRWITYDYTPTGAPNPERISLGNGAYDPFLGYAYSIEVEDPDNTGGEVSYSTSGKIDGSAGSKTFGSGPDRATISYVSTTVNNLNVSSGSSATEFGTFSISTQGAGASIPVDGVRFEIQVDMTSPFTATRVIRGTIESGTITNSSVGTVVLNFDSDQYDLMGSTMGIDNDPLTPNPPNTNSGDTTVSGTMTSVEPIRLLVKSTGYGPRGATKELEAIVRKNFFDGMSAPATLTLVGPPTGFAFASGNSQNVTYSGDDIVSNFQLPPIGTSNDANLADVNADLAATGIKTDVIGFPANVAVEMPPWLRSAENLDDVIQALRNLAESSGRLFPSGTTPPDWGNNTNATGITFVDGDTTFSGAGGGILVVTGELTLHGNFDFNGLIIVTGTTGLTRSGGGTGSIQGNIVIAPYDPANVAAGFTGPMYDISGGGTSDLTYNSSSLANGLTAVSNFVLGVAEK